MRYIVGGLTQVLADGTNTYLYGLGRIGEEQPSGWAYHLADALGSVRQLTDADGAVTMVQSFKPYGGVLEREGEGASYYSFTGEWADGSGLVFLRARYLDAVVGRFLARDPLGISRYQPGSSHPYAYTANNPVNAIDPTGLARWPIPEGRRWIDDSVFLSMPANYAITHIPHFVAEV